MLEVLLGSSIVGGSILLAGIYLKRSLKIPTIPTVDDLSHEMPKLVEPIYEKAKNDVQEYIEKNLPLIADDFATALGNNLMKRVGAINSSNVRMDKGMASAIATDVINDKIPGLGGFIGPAAKKYLGMNPDAIISILQNPMVQNFIKNKAGNLLGGSGGDGGSGSDVDYSNLFK